MSAQGAAVDYDVDVDDTELHPTNVGNGPSWCGFGIRSLVSKKKRRFVGAGVDLDLSYITNRIIAMGYPSVGFEAIYRNPCDDVRRFLDQRHKFHYRIWNLCCEREYSPGLFNVEIERFAWSDHTPPALALMLPAMESMDSWLEAHPDNVAVIHCKAGKGRTGTIIAAYLVHSHLSRSADEAVEFFGWRRTKNGRGVTIPSQHRYVRCYAMQAAAQQYIGGDGGDAAAAAGGMAGAGASGGAEASAGSIGAASAAAGAAESGAGVGGAASASGAAVSPAAAPGGAGGVFVAGPSPRAEGVGLLAPAPGAAAAAAAGGPYTAATALVVRTEDEGAQGRHFSAGGYPAPAAALAGHGSTPSSGAAAAAAAAPRLVLTVRVERDSERTPGFSIDQNARLRPVVAGFKKGPAAAAGGDAAAPAGPVLDARRAGAASSGEGAASPSASHLRSLAGPGGRATRATSGGRAGSIDAMNSVVPVPVRDVLRRGDELLAVNGVDLAHRAFSEVVSILRSAVDPLTLTFAREAASVAAASSASSAAALSFARGTGAGGASFRGRYAWGSTSGSGAAAAAAAEAPAEPPVPAAEYLRRVAGGIGPWAAGGQSDPRAVPTPPVQLLGVYLSHVPRLRGRAGFCGTHPLCADPGAIHEDEGEVASGLYLQLYGGPGCRSLLWDSRAPHAAAGGSGVVAAATGGARMFEATAPSLLSRGGGGVSLSARGTPTPGSAAGGGASSSSSSRRHLSAGSAGGVSTGEVELAPPTLTRGATPVAAGAPAASASAAAISAPSSHSHSSLLRVGSGAPASAESEAHLSTGGAHGSAAAGASPASAGGGAANDRRAPVSTKGQGEGEAAVANAAVGWDGDRFFPQAAGAAGSVTAAGDFRLVFCVAGRKKPFAGLWLNTACFPLPGAAVPALAAELAAAPLPPLRELSRSALVGSPMARPALSPAPAPAATPGDAPEAAGGASTGLRAPAPVPPLAMPGSPTASGGAAVPVLPQRGSVPSSPQAREGVTRTLWLGPDVPGGVIGPGVPLLGALYTAAGGYRPHLPMPWQLSSSSSSSAARGRAGSAGTPAGAEAASAAAASAAEGVVFFTKGQVDGAVRDKRHRAFPADFTIALRFRAVALPPEYAGLLAGAAV
jgi:hypothetical protein